MQTLEIALLTHQCFGRGAFRRLILACSASLSCSLTSSDPITHARHIGLRTHDPCNFWGVRPPPPPAQYSQIPSQLAHVDSTCVFADVCEVSPQSLQCLRPESARRVCLRRARTMNGCAVDAVLYAARFPQDAPAM